jgi:alpha-tubulin suppressor-like RCC1 family protein
VAPLGSLGHPVALAAGGDHTCALLEGGQIKCWGSNAFGELGIGVNETGWGDQPGEMGNNLPIVDLGSGRTALAVSAGETHTCALLDTHQVKCWGGNDRGQLGLDSTVGRGTLPADMGDNLPAVNLGTGRTALAIATGSWHTCAVLDTHQLKCWGDNAYGEAGQDDLTNNFGDGYVGMTDVMEMGDQLPFVDLGP